jgi:hypothetical protein
VLTELHDDSCLEKVEIRWYVKEDRENGRLFTDGHGRMQMLQAAWLLVPGFEDEGGHVIQ